MMGWDRPCDTVRFETKIAFNNYDSEVIILFLSRFKKIAWGWWTMSEFGILCSISCDWTCHLIQTNFRPGFWGGWTVSDPDSKESLWLPALANGWQGGVEPKGFENVMQ